MRLPDTESWTRLRAAGRVFFAVLGLAALAPAARPAQQDRPNVLFVIADDLTATALGCYGNEQCQTPNLDRLAARSVRFTRAYCQFPVCGPSRASLLSGLYPGSNGVLGNGGAQRLAAALGERPALPEHFRDHGYRTVRVSKLYHMRVPGDITAGVDGPDHADSWTERYNCQAQEWMTEGEHEALSNEELDPDPEKHYGLGYGTAFYSVRASRDSAPQADTLAADRAIEILTEQGEDPFFLAVGFVRPHVPLVAPEAFHAAHPAEEMRVPPVPEGDAEDIPEAGRSRYTSQRRGLEDPATKRSVLSAYSASVAFMDHELGRVLDALDAAGHAENTIVVFTSDHGYHLGEHDFWQKLSLHEESARVPLLIAAPGLAPAVCESLVELVDLYPTLAEAAGLPIPEHCEGRSLGPLLVDPSRSVRESAACFLRRGQLVRTTRWAYMAYTDGSSELYDMDADPRQLTNLIGQPEVAETIAHLRKSLVPASEPPQAER